MSNTGITGLLNISRSSLLANSQAIRVVGNNIANVNTPGYSRRKVEMETVILGGREEQLGAGVTLARSRRIVDQFIDRYYRATLTDQGSATVRDDLLRRAEGPFSLENKATSVGYKLSEFFSAIDDLAANPSDTALRQNLIQKGQLLTQSIRTTYSAIATLQREADNRLAFTVTEVNGLTQQLADVNEQIRATQATGESPGLLDRRDEILRQLSGKLKVNAVEGDDGTYSIYLDNGFALVTSAGAKQLSADTTPTTTPPVTFPPGLDGAGLTHIVYDFDSGAGESHLDLTSILANGGGEIGGLLNTRGVQATTDTNPFQARGDLVSIASRIEAISRDLLTRFNTTYLGADGDTSTAGFQPSAVALDGTTPAVYGLFSATGLVDGGNGLPDDLAAGTSYASRIDFAISDPTKIAAAWDTSTTTAAITFAPGDNRNLLALAALRTAPTAYSVGNYTATTTIEGLYEDTTTYVGSVASAAENNRIIADDRQSQTRGVLENVSGVSEDEEFTNLIAFQKAYQGSARLVKIADDLMEELINLL